MNIVLYIIILLVCLVLAVWLVRTYMPNDPPPLKGIVIVLLVLLVLYLILSRAGII